MGKQIAANAIRFVGIPVEAGTKDARLVVDGLRCNANQLGVSSTLAPTSVTAHVQISPTFNEELILSTATVTVGFLQYALATTSRDAIGIEAGPVGVVQDSTGTWQAKASLRFRELMPSAFQNREQEQGTQGIRFLLQLSAIPRDAVVRVSRRNLETGPPVVALVRTDSNGAGQSDMDPAEEWVSLDVFNGTAVSAWEWVDPSPDSLTKEDQFSIGVELQLNTTRIPYSDVGWTASLAPLSTVGTASDSAPVPRFVPSPSGGPLFRFVTSLASFRAELTREFNEPNASKSDDWWSAGDFRWDTFVAPSLKKIPATLLGTPNFDVELKKEGSVTIDEVLDKGHSAVLFGPPGSGKTTLARWLLRRWAEVGGDRVPVLMEIGRPLRHYSSEDSGNSLSHYLFRQAGLDRHIGFGDFAERLKAGKVIAIFDGLDGWAEPRGQLDGLRQIDQFAADYPEVQVLVTTRGGAISLPKERFHLYAISGFDQRQVADFVRLWTRAFDTVGPDSILTLLQRNGTAKTLASNPMLLTALATLHRHRRSIPHVRAEFLRLVARVLLEKRFTSTTDRGSFDLADIESILRATAPVILSNKEEEAAGRTIGEPQLLDLVETSLRRLAVGEVGEAAKSIVHAVRVGGSAFADTGLGRFGFVHQSLLEFFAAWHLVWQFKEDQTLSYEQLERDVFGVRWRDLEWHPVLSLVMGMIAEDKAVSLLRSLIVLDGSSDEYRNLRLAAECVGEVRNQRVVAPIRTAIVSRCDTEIEAQQVERNGSERAPILVQVVSAIGGEEAYQWLRKALDSNPDHILRISALKELAREWKDRPDTIGALFEAARRAGDAELQTSALAEIRKAQPTDEATLGLLLELAGQNVDPVVRLAAIAELGASWDANESALGLLRQLAEADSNLDVRAAACEWVKNAQGIS